ncbi:MAG: carboxymuconolactone decarboxylase family protein [Gammaproteobacteria bacterium]|nr:carboxymuconolactone decarboxylase family protein [Gammaproteobacteria bacterium]
MRHIKHIAIALVIAFSIPVGLLAEAQAMNHTKSLDARQKSIVTIAAFTADGDMERLDKALTEGLEAGLTVSEIKEVLVQMYAYAGFPRSLNGLFAFMRVLDERKSAGILDEPGKAASPLPPDMDKDVYGAKVRASLAGQDQIPSPSEWQLFAPVIDTYLKEHLFADIFARDVLDFQSRELATIGALANMQGAGGQLRFHLGAAMNTGLSAAQLEDFIAVLRAKVGEPEASQAAALLEEVLSARGK